MIRANLVVLSEKGFPRVTVKIFYSPGGESERILQQIETVLSRRNFSAAISDFTFTLSGTEGLQNIATVLGVLKMIYNSYQHLGVTAGAPIQERRKGEIQTRSFPFKFGKPETQLSPAAKNNAPSWAQGGQQDPWGEK